MDEFTDPRPIVMAEKRLKMADLPIGQWVRVEQSYEGGELREEVAHCADRLLVHLAEADE